MCAYFILVEQLDLIIDWETGPKEEGLGYHLQEKTWILLNVLHIMLKKHPGNICEERWSNCQGEDVSVLHLSFACFSVQKCNIMLFCLLK